MFIALLQSVSKRDPARPDRSLDASSFISDILTPQMNTASRPATRTAGETMRILCIGGGPAGLYFVLLMKKADPRHAVRVVERNRPYDTFGWGVVFSDNTLQNLDAADRETAAEIAGAFNHWDDIDVHFKGRTITSGGHGFCGIGRKRLLNILQRRCESLGVELVFETDVADDVEAASEFRAD